VRTLIRAALASLLSVVVLAGPVSAATSQTTTVAQATQSGTISGHVTSDTGAAVAGAQVVIDGSGQHQTTATDNAGNFSASVPPGLYTLSIIKGGYQTGSSDVTVAAGTPVSVNVALTQASLNNLNVIGRTTSSGNSGAKFDISSSPSSQLSQAQILDRSTPDLTSVLQELPGVTIPRATSNPNQSFIVRGMRFETKTTLDGHPVSSGTLGMFLTNYASAGIFSGVDVEKGAGLTGPLAGESGVGTVNLLTPDFGKTGAFTQVGVDNYGGTQYNAILKLNFLKDDKLSFVLGRTFSGYRGPTYGLQEPNFTGATPPLGTFSPPQNLTNDIATFITDFSDTYSLNAELAKMRYKFSDSTSLSLEFLGLQGRFDPQGGAYGQFVGYATVPQCLNGGSTGAFGAACNAGSEYNTPAASALIGQGGTPLYAFFPGSDVRQNSPNFNADFRTTLGNDTILLRPYTAAINRLIDGTQENNVPGDAGGWYEVTNSANCMVQSNIPSSAGVVPAGGTTGPCFAANTPPAAAFVNNPNVPHVFTTTAAPLVCTPTTPCFTTPTAQNNAGQFGYGAPFTTLEVDKLAGYTFQYIHPVGANTYSVSFDHYLDDTIDFTNDASPLAPGCTFVLGSGIPNTPGAPGSQAGCPLINLRPSPIAVPETLSSVSSLALTAQFQLTSKLQFGFGGYFTHYVINGQQENPAFAAAQTALLAPSGRTGATPVQLSAIFNSASHFDPHFGLEYRANRDLSFRFSGGSSLSIPYASLVSGFQTYSQGSTSTTVSTPNFALLPEEVVSLDLGGDYRTPDGTIISADIYNTVVHNPWVQPKVVICPGGPGCVGGGLAGLEPTLATYSSQTLNGAQQYAQGIEFSITHEPAVGLGYRVNAAFERNYYLDMPAAFFPAGSPAIPASGGNPAVPAVPAAPQVFFNGNQFTSTGSGSTSVPYAKGYAEVQYASANQGLLRIGVDYEGNNNEYNAPAFFVFDMGGRINTGFHDVLLGAAVENLFNLNFNSLLGRGVEFQGLEPIAAVASPGGYTYSKGAFNTALVSPGPTTYRITLTKRF
jgi:hypothetical protein